MVKMTSRWVEGVRAPGRYGDDATPGLQLRIRPNGSKSWTLRVTLNGRRVDRTLGPWDEVSLAEARDRAREWRREARQGRDPARSRAQAAAPLTFEAAAREFHALYRPSWAPGHAKRWLASLEADVFPRLPDKPMVELEPTDLVAVLAPIWTTKNDTAKRIRQRVAAVFEWAHG